MRKLVIGALVGLVVMSVLLTAANVSADGSSSGTFPDRVFSVIRSPPGGPHSDTFSVDILPTATGSWWVSASNIAGSAVIVQLWQNDGGVLTLLSSSKLRAVGQESTHTLLSAGLIYSASFTPYGKAGTSALMEHYSLPHAPVACFSFSPVAPTTADTVSFDASCSTDLDNDITTYQWDFQSDGTFDATGVSASFQFTSAGTYHVTLKVTDSTSLFGTASLDVTVTAVANLAPKAAFSASRNLMVVGVDGSASSDPDGSITDYSWAWGDGITSSSGVNPLSAHTYSGAGLYTITLTVTDNGAPALTGSVSHAVTVNTTTVDFSYHDFFTSPYGEWWDMRTFVYGDKPIGANCFNSTSIADGYCAVKDTTKPAAESYPYTNWYPSPVDSTGKFAFVYTPYRFDAQVKNSPAYSIDQPVILPTCAQLSAAATSLGLSLACPATMPAGGSVTMDLYLQYLDIAREVTISTGAAPNDCPDLTGANDGFLIEQMTTLVLDQAAMTKLFGVTSPSDLTPTLTKTGCGSASKFDATKSGVLEKAYAAWLVSQGNGPYDIFSSFEYPYTMQFMDITPSYSTATGMYTVTLHVGTWGDEVLLARKFYWGATLYASGVTDLSVKPQGWWGMELAWFEDLRMHATIGSSFSASLSGAMQYHFQNNGAPGPDGLYSTSDDVDSWVWQPTLSDYIPSYGSHPYSELDRYLGYQYVHTTPGSKNYGLLGAYDYVPQVWALGAGQTQTFAFPTGPVVMYDPFLSVGTTDGSGLVPIATAIKLGSTTPAGYASYDAATNVAIVMGPTFIAAPALTSGGAPIESRPILTLVHA